MKTLILALKDSADVFVLRLTKKMRIFRQCDWIEVETLMNDLNPDLSTLWYQFASVLNVTALSFVLAYMSGKSIRKSCSFLFEK